MGALDLILITMRNSEDPLKDLSLRTLDNIKLQGRKVMFSLCWHLWVPYGFHTLSKLNAPKDRIKSTIKSDTLKGNIPRISSYTWLFAKNTGWFVVLRSNP